MTEEFIQYAWKYQMFDRSLSTVTGEKISVIDPGIWNQDSGPDFFNAQVVIGNTRWAGNVEVHVRASDWELHGHTDDKAYRNVILHVVYEYDRAVFRHDRTEIPVFELKSFLRIKAYKVYKYLLRSRAGIACQDMIGLVDGIYMTDWVEALAAARIVRKVERMEELMSSLGNDFERMLIIQLFRAFGNKVNAFPFELLGRSIPPPLLRKARGELFALEALLFGMAGFLNKDFREPYPNLLKSDFQYLAKKHDLTPIDMHLWKFLRLRPPNFPTVRIAQLASLIHEKGIPSPDMKTEDYDSLVDLFSTSVSEYWAGHYVFERTSKERNKGLGRQFIDNLIINYVIPAGALKERIKGEDSGFDWIMGMMRQMQPEKNRITDYFSELQIEVGSAVESQAFIELKTRFCDYKKCLNCRIGHVILKHSG